MNKCTTVKYRSSWIISGYQYRVMVKWIAYWIVNSGVNGSIPEGGKPFFFLKICFWSVNRDPVLRICHRTVWQSVKVCHSKQFTDSQKQICNRPETESVCYLGLGFWVKIPMRHWFLLAHQPQHASAICYWNVTCNSFRPENFPLTTLKECLALFVQWERGTINATSLLPLSQSTRFFARIFVTVQSIAMSQ
jgi:hypothetical protein